MKAIWQFITLMTKISLKTTDIVNFDRYHLTPYRQSSEYVVCIFVDVYEPPPSKKRCPWYDTKLHLIVRFLFGRSKECWVLLHCHYFYVHSDLENIGYSFIAITSMSTLIWRLLIIPLFPLLLCPLWSRESWVLLHYHYFYVYSDLENVEYSFIAITPMSTLIWRVLGTPLLPLLLCPLWSGECWLLLHFHYFYVHSDLENVGYSFIAITSMSTLIWRAFRTPLLPLILCPLWSGECWVLLHYHYFYVYSDLENVEYSFITITSMSTLIWRAFSTRSLPLILCPLWSEECWVLLQNHYSNVHSDSE